jgi:hypothetical protein
MHEDFFKIIFIIKLNLQLYDCENYVLSSEVHDNNLGRQEIKFSPYCTKISSFYEISRNCIWLARGMAYHR